MRQAHSMYGFASDCFLIEISHLFGMQAFLYLTNQQFLFSCIATIPFWLRYDTNPTLASHPTNFCLNPAWDILPPLRKKSGNGMVAKRQEPLFQEYMSQGNHSGEESRV